MKIYKTLQHNKSYQKFYVHYDFNENCERLHWENVLSFFAEIFSILIFIYDEYAQDY